MTCAELLRDANFDAWESVQSALEKLPSRPPEHALWLVQHILETKLEYGRLIAQALSRPGPPDLELSALMTWEVDEAAALTPENLAEPLQYGQRTMTVVEVLSLNARHSVWHAGQLVALFNRTQETP